MELVPPRGTQDLLPDRADAMLGLYDEAHRVGRLFGYRYVETPTFEQPSCSRARQERRPTW